MQIKRLNLEMDEALRLRDSAKERGADQFSPEHQAKYDKARARKLKLVGKAQQDPFDMYESLMGEADARAVQTRRDLTMEERLARPFWLDYDKGGALDKQIVRY